MARRLAYTVFVPDEHGEVTKFGPEDDVPSWARKLIGDHAYESGDDDGEDEPEPYSKWSKPALEAEIAKRNTDRDDDEQIEPDAPGNKPDLIAALEADDQVKA